MPFVWPFKAEYRVVYLSPNGDLTIIGRSKRDYVWIMARTPSVADEDYSKALELIAAYGYDIQRVQKVPQKGI